MCGRLAMTKNRAAIAEVTGLLDAYRDAAARHGEATEKGDYALANSMAAIVATEYAELRRRGVRGNCVQAGSSFHRRIAFRRAMGVA